MPEVNPYFNPIYADAAENIVAAFRGDPEKAGALAFQKEKTRSAAADAARQEMENTALSDELEAALAVGQGDPAAWADNMARTNAVMARAGITDPGKFYRPQWAMEGEAQSGASPAEALVRAAYAGGGTAIPLDLALTPERSDAIRAQKADAALNQAVSVQQERNRAPGKPGGGNKPYAPKLKDTDALLLSALSGIQGITEIAGEDTANPKTVYDPAAQAFMAQSGVADALRAVASDTLRRTGGDQEAARRAVADVLTDVASFDAGGVVGPATKAYSKFNPFAPDGAPRSGVFGRDIPGTPAQPGLIDREGNPVDVEALLRSLTPPPVVQEGGGGAVMVSSPDEAMALPSGTVFITPDGRRKVRP